MMSNEWSDKSYELGYWTKKGTKISLGTWSNIFNNRFYMGQMLWGSEIYEGGHEKMVSVETYEKVQSQLTKRRSVIKTHYFYPLSGLVWSEDSQSRMIGHSATNGSGKTLRYYKSISKATNNRQHYALADNVEAHFAKFLFNIQVVAKKLANNMAIDPDIMLGLKVASSVGALYSHLQDYQQVYLSKLIVEGKGINISGDKVISIALTVL